MAACKRRFFAYGGGMWAQLISLSAYLGPRLLYVKIMLSWALYMTRVVDLVLEGLRTERKFSVNIDMLAPVTLMGVI